MVDPDKYRLPPNLPNQSGCRFLPWARTLPSSRLRDHKYLLRKHEISATRGKSRVVKAVR